VTQSWLVLSGQKIFGNSHEWLGILHVEAQLENGLRVWEIVFGELAVKSSSWRPEIRNSRCDTQASSCQYNDSFVLFVLQSSNQFFVFETFLLFLSIDGKGFKLLKNLFFLFLFSNLCRVSGEF
jgi:hypothetical protein